MNVTKEAGAVTDAAPLYFLYLVNAAGIKAQAFPSPFSRPLVDINGVQWWIDLSDSRGYRIRVFTVYSIVEQVADAHNFAAVLNLSFSETSHRVPFSAAYPGRGIQEVSEDRYRSVTLHEPTGGPGGGLFKDERGRPVPWSVNVPLNNGDHILDAYSGPKNVGVIVVRVYGGEVVGYLPCDLYRYRMEDQEFFK